MKKFSLVMFVIFCTALALSSQYDWDFEYWGQIMQFAMGPITVEQAKAAIINWSGRDNLIIKLCPIYSWEKPWGRAPSGGLKPNGDLLTNYTTMYAFSVEDPNPGGKYSGTVYVDSWSGMVMEIFKSFGQVRDNRNIANMLTPQQALNRAKEIVLSYFPNVPIDSLTPDWVDDEPTEDGSSWKAYDDYLSVNFQKVLYTPNGEEVRIGVQSVGVSMDSNTGELVHMNYCYEPLEISPIPILTREEIAQAVVSFFYGLGAESVGVCDLGNGWDLEREEPYGVQRLFTVMAFGVVPSPDIPDDVKALLENLNFCWVDGHTGEIFYAAYVAILGGPSGRITVEKSSSPIVIFNGLRRSTSSPPILKDGHIFISSDDVKAMGFKVSRKCYIVAYNRNKAELSGEDILIRGEKQYIKVDALGKIKGVVVNYRKRENEVHIVVLNEKLFQMGLEYRAKVGKKVAPSSSK